MAPLNDRAALVVLLRTGKRPWQQYADLVEEAGSATTVLEGERDPQETLFAPGSSQDAAHAEPSLDDSLADAVAEIERWEAEGMRLLTVLDPGYPENLRTVHDRPPLVFVAGELIPDDARSIAIVGARNATARGIETAAAIADHVAASGYTVVSGLARGIDTAAHKAALAMSSRTVAVIGTGLNRTYPPENADLQRRIARSGAVVSQFWPDAPPTKKTFPMRNAVMSGLSLASVVVEASQTSGSRMQARLALEHGRPVFLPRPLLEQEWARRLSARPGAHVVGSPQEITAAVERLTSSSALTA
jgi:DNA processing protein